MGQSRHGSAGKNGKKPTSSQLTQPMERAMRGKVAKKLRRIIYGKDYVTGVNGRNQACGNDGQVMADDNRLRYKKAKKIWSTNRDIIEEWIANMS